MPSFTSASEKAFIAFMLACSCILGMWLYTQGNQLTQRILLEQKDWKINNIPAVKKPWFSIIGTSRAGSHRLPKYTPYIDLSGAYTIPPIMYFKAKTLLHYHPNIQAVYLEADAHIFFYGGTYAIRGDTPAEKQKSYAYINWNAFFDEEAETLFGKPVTDTAVQGNVFDDNIKPIIIKRMVEHLINRLAWLKPAATATPTLPPCDAASEATLELPASSAWSIKTDEERAHATFFRLVGFTLEKESRLDPLMTGYFEKTIALFENAGVDIILIRYPLSPEYHAGMHPTNKALHEQYLNGLIEQHNLRTLDLNYLPEGNLAFFENMDHPVAAAHPFMGATIMKDFCTHYRLN